MDVDNEDTQESHAPSIHRPSSPVQRASSVPFNSPSYRVGYVYSSDMMLHSSSHGHPEQPDRITRIRNTIRDRGLLSKMKQLPIRPVKKQEALLVHSEEHWDKVLAIHYMTPQDIIDSESYYESLSLYVMSGTTRAARLSCGGVIEACLAVARGELQKSFAIVRPPGHHAEPEEHMGFCFFNNVAVAAKVTQLLTPVRKILILDWCNGTQRAFNDDPSVLYISLHRYERGQFYPCGPFGSMESSGEGPGLGYSVNIPWPKKGMGDSDYIHAFQQIVMPIAMEFAPELVIISAGFDAAAGDDLGECFVTPAGYAHMTHMLSGLASGKLVVALEGGYNLDSISKSALAVVEVLLGSPPPELPPQQVMEAGTETVWQVAMEQSKYWKSVNPKACEPQILKAHRQHHLYTQYEMLQVPLMTQAFEERFGSQVMCTSDILENPTMVVFVHEFGNLRIELDGKSTCDVRLEHSYLIDFSKELIGWIQGERYALLDINLFPRPFASTPLRGSSEHLSRDLLTYLWDNYIQLSQAKRIVIVGHGPGCKALVEFLENRRANVMKYVSAVVQVVGNVDIPAIPKSLEDLRLWYENHSLVILHNEHPVFISGIKIMPKRHGRVIKIDEKNPIKLMMQALPLIQDYMKTALASPV
ncbi:Arginase/deacetylase [Leucogyrophana mollusca]|uniref:Arginase/deacetylase n=1 Tax=Leucogyrophana mollusca TaxID=85980 RepID=A0ACB8BNR1_9AGAM|nr:Arginase/deacetylase [Leucogyrophana mollusca]